MPSMLNVDICILVTLDNSLLFFAVTEAYLHVNSIDVTSRLYQSRKPEAVGWGRYRSLEDQSRIRIKNKLNMLNLFLTNCQNDSLALVLASRSVCYRYFRV